jgi:DNA-binding CsgD family transcriptional regulator
MGLEETVVAVETCANQDELNQVLQRIITDYGFAAYCFLDIGGAHASNFYYFGTTGPAWEQEYLSNGFFDVDEVIKLARRTNRLFTWGSVPLPHRLGRKKPGALKVFEASADYRFNEGLVVPLHFVDELGRIHSALCSLIWQDSVRDFSTVVRTAEFELHLILLYWMQRSMELRAAEYNPGVYNLYAARELALGVHLTDRERDVIGWAGRGKTVNETADILSISHETVETYVKSAIDKLGAGNKTHAVAKAIHLGLIDM